MHRAHGHVEEMRIAWKLLAADLATARQILFEIKEDMEKQQHAEHGELSLPVSSIESVFCNDRPDLMKKLRLASDLDYDNVAVQQTQEWIKKIVRKKSIDFVNWYTEEVLRKS